MRTFVIVEAGSCHDGSLERAQQLVELAKTAGADAVKFQFWSDSARLAKRRHVDDEDPIRDHYKRYQLPAEWLPILRRAAEKHDLGFLCTTYLPEDVATVAPLVGIFKVSSFEGADRELLEAHRPFLDDHELLVSDGGREQDVLAPTLKVFTRNRERKRVHLLHCVSAYPAPTDQLNLSILRRGYAGFSDHSGDTLTGALAVAVVGPGPLILEVHAKLEDTETSNPDAGAFAHSPFSLRRYIDNVRFAEAALGNGKKQLQPAERDFVKYRVA
ncbi:MAG TPA: N-acetylneuraminate synthase family protein [Vicinamibacterales bacterium]|nr:N-acetylneuraminate synthase family protein [Vicinamibacterales bacterium]